MPTALITGVSKGIGLAITQTLLANEWKVYGISRSDPQLTHPNFKWLEFDLMQFENYATLPSLISENLDLLVNNAGISYKVKVKDIISLDLDKQFAMNVKSPILMIKTLLPKLQQGKIINMSSIASKVSYRGEEADISVYSATKAALNTFAREFAHEVPIPIASILPTMVNTPLLHTMYPNDPDVAKYLQPEDIAKVVLELLKNGFETGDEFVIVNDFLAGEADLITAQHRDPKILNTDLLTPNSVPSNV